MAARVSHAAQAVRAELSRKAEQTRSQTGPEATPKLSYNEMCWAINKALPGLEPLAIYYLQMYVLDADGDGYLELHEWDAMMKQYSQGGCPGVLELWDISKEH